MTHAPKCACKYRHACTYTCMDVCLYVLSSLFSPGLVCVGAWIIKLCMFKSVLCMWCIAKKEAPQLSFPNLPAMAGPPASFSPMFEGNPSPSVDTSHQTWRLQWRHALEGKCKNYIVNLCRFSTPFSDIKISHSMLLSCSKWLMGWWYVDPY